MAVMAGVLPQDGVYRPLSVLVQERQRGRPSHRPLAWIVPSCHQSVREPGQLSVPCGCEWTTNSSRLAQRWEDYDFTTKAGKSKFWYFGRGMTTEEEDGRNSASSLFFSAQSSAWLQPLMLQGFRDGWQTRFISIGLIILRSRSEDVLECGCGLAGSSICMD